METVEIIENTQPIKPTRKYKTNNRKSPIELAGDTKAQKEWLRKNDPQYKEMIKISQNRIKALIQ